MADQVAFQKLKNIVSTIFDGFKTVSTQLADGFQLTDLLALVPLVPGINEAVKDFPEAKQALLSLNEEQKTELLAHWKTKFDLSNDELEELIEAIVDYAVDAIEFGKRGIELVNRIKNLKQPETPEA